MKPRICVKISSQIVDPQNITVQSLNESACAIIKSFEQTDFFLQVVMTITSGANAKNCTIKCQIRDELLFLAAFQIHYSH